MIPSTGSGEKSSPATGRVGPVENPAMDRLREFLEDVRRLAPFRGNFLGLLNILIGRHIAKTDGTPVSDGLTWRELAAVLKKYSWDKDLVRELGLDPAKLAPRDREQYWYMAINRAHVDSPEASQAGDRLAAALKKAGYVVRPERRG
jgi:hypothetical protein